MVVSVEEHGGLCHVDSVKGRHTISTNAGRYSTSRKVADRPGTYLRLSFLRRQKPGLT